MKQLNPAQVVKVVECWECPFMGGESGLGETWNVCNAPRTPEQDQAAGDNEVSPGEPPGWCPLRASQIAVMLGGVAS